MESLHTPPQTKQSLLPIFALIFVYIIVTLFGGGMIAFPFYSVFNVLVQASDSFYYQLVNAMIPAVFLLIAAWVVAWLFLKYINFLPTAFLGMSIKGRWKDCVAGFLFSLALYTVGFGISIAFNAFDIAVMQFDPAVLFWTFIFYLIAAAFEEIMVRGYIQGLLTTRMNKFKALVIASIIFSAMHSLNSGIGVLPFLNLFIAGLFLGASYMYTRNLWFPIFLHTTWNWVQGSVLGYRVSGEANFSSWLNLQWTEDNLINGGSFGFEGSIICTILTLVGTALIIGWYELGIKKIARKE